jgi:hypothetical protein
VGFLSKYGREGVSLSLGMVGLSQLVFGLLPVRTYSSESFAQFSTYQSLLIGVSILVSAPTYSLLLASRFNAENNEKTFRSARNWLASTFLLILALIILVSFLFKNLNVLIVAVLFSLAFLSNFESAVLRSRLSFDEQWVHISAIFFAEAALRFVVATIHFAIGTPGPVILIAENICLQLVTVLVAIKLLGRDGWNLTSPFTRVLFVPYYLLLLVTLSTLILNTFIAPLAQLVNLDQPREISLAIYLLMFSRIPATILFPIIQPEIQRLVLIKDYKVSFSKIFVIPLFSNVFYFLLFYVFAWKFIDIPEVFGDTPFFLMFVVSMSLAVLFIFETSAAFFLVNSNRLNFLVKLYFGSILVILLLVAQVSTAFGLIALVISSEIIFLVAFVIGLQFRKKLPS